MKLSTTSAHVTSGDEMNKTTLANAADWHGVQAVKAYRRKDMDAFVRHVRIADQLWADVGDLG